jgi:hypothetical protein
MSALDILVIESHRGTATDAAHALEAAGHRVGRCHDPDSRGFPCRGVVDPSSCPLAARPDLALLVRSHVEPRPTPLEQGVSCALRAGVPLVEAGPATLDPYDPWLAARVRWADDVVGACEAVASAAGPGVEQALAVRALDAVRDGGRTAGSVDVSVHAPG